MLSRLLDSYQEYQNPASLRAVERNRSSTPVTNNFPVTFPESYPFSLATQGPKANPTASGSLDVKPEVSPGLGEGAIVILVLILSAPKKHIVGFLESILEIEGRDHLAALLLQFFKVAASILNNEAFPKNWLNVNILAHRVLLKMMDPIATMFEREFIPDEASGRPFDSSLWKECFHVLLKLLSSEHLVIEEFSPQVGQRNPLRILYVTLTLVPRNDEPCGVSRAISAEKVQPSYSGSGARWDGQTRPRPKRLRWRGTR